MLEGGSVCQFVYCLITKAYVGLGMSVTMTSGEPIRSSSFALCSFVDVSQLVAMEILGEDPVIKNIWQLSIESWNKQTVPTSKL